MTLKGHPAGCSCCTALLPTRAGDPGTSSHKPPKVKGKKAA